MIHSVGGTHSTSPGWVERIAREQGAQAQPDVGEQGAHRAAQDFDPEKAVTVSNLANRSVSYRGAIGSLEDLGTYLAELI